MKPCMTENDTLSAPAQGADGFSPRDIGEMLDREAARINSPEFIAADPVQFPRRFSERADIEIASLLAATIAWGNRTMICRDAERMFALMDWQPHAYVMDRGYEELPDGNIHRTFFASDLREWLRALNAVYTRYETLDDYALAKRVGDDEMPAWALARALNAELAEANPGGRLCRCLPQNLDQTALKRLNMALRWLVRRDGIVDLGIWRSIEPRQLFIPLDVHVGNVSRQLGLLTRRANDRRAVVELTEALRRYRPDDPVIYDYALFGLGIESKNAKCP